MSIADSKRFTVTTYVATPANPAAAQHGTTGATAYGYKVEAVDELGGVSVATAQVDVADGNAVLSAVDHIEISWDAVPGATAYRVHRTVGGATQGLIGTVYAPLVELNDTGGLVTAATPSAVNTSGIGPAVKTQGMQSKTVQAGGTFVGTIQMQGSCQDPPVDWVNEGDAFTAVGVKEVSESFVWMRTKMTAYTSGTPTFVVSGN